MRVCAGVCRRTGFVHDVIRLDLIQVQHDVLGVNHGEHRIQKACVLDVFVHEEGLDDGRGVGQAGGLNHDGVELALALDELVQDPDQIAAHGAADLRGQCE